MCGARVTLLSALVPLLSVAAEARDHAGRDHLAALEAPLFELQSLEEAVLQSHVTLAADTVVALAAFMDETLGVTDALRDVATEQTGAFLFGLKFKRKKASRLAEKIQKDQGDASDSAGVLRVGIAQSDYLRFTVIHTTERYTAGVQAMRGLDFWSPHKQKNFWAAEDYHGINDVMKVPLTLDDLAAAAASGSFTDAQIGLLRSVANNGQIICHVEVQHHTVASFTAKESSHLLYEKQRSDDTPALTKLAAVLIKRELFVHRLVPVPPGALELPKPTRKPQMTASKIHEAVAALNLPLLTAEEAAGPNAQLLRTVAIKSQMQKAKKALRKELKRKFEDKVHQVKDEIAQTKRLWADDWHAVQEIGTVEPLDSSAIEEMQAADLGSWHGLTGVFGDVR